MKRLFKILLAIATLGATVANSKTASVGLGDNYYTEFSVPGSAAGRGVDAIDFYMDPGDVVGGSGNGSGSGSTGGFGRIGGAEGFMMWADQLGSAQLRQRMAENEAAKEYQYQLDKFENKYRQQIQKEPMLQSELSQFSGVVPSGNMASFDSEDEKNLLSSGQGLVLADFKSYRQLIAELNRHGGHYSTGSTDEEYTFADILDRELNQKFLSTPGTSDVRRER